MAGTIKLLGTGQAGGPGTDDGNGFIGTPRRGLRYDPALLKGMFDNLFFNLLDGDRRLVNGQHTRFFAGSRAQPTGKFGEVIGQ